MNENYTPERLADRAQIQDAIYTWCRGFDRKDWDMARSVFAERAEDHHGVYVGEVDGLIEFLKERHLVIRQSSHFIGNVLIEFAGPDVALAESYINGVQVYSKDGAATGRKLLGPDVEIANGQEILASVYSRYIDEFERRDGVWKIVRRTTVLENIDAKIYMGAAGETDIWVIQKRDPSDFLLTRRKQLGIDRR